MNCELVERLLSGAILTEDAGGTDALRSHAERCFTCGPQIEMFLTEEALLRDTLGRREAASILRGVSKRRRRSFAAGFAAAVAAALLAGFFLARSREPLEP